MRTTAIAMLCCLLPTLLVLGFVIGTVLFSEAWNQLLDRVFPGRPH